MRRVRAYLAPFAVLLAAASMASAEELSEIQQAAFTAILPGLSDALEDQGGTELGELAPMLATCVVTQARRREVRSLSGPEISNEDRNLLLNEILARPSVQGCVAKEAAG
ncbi:MAG: hypothetical protein AAF647_06215 [Pseudomonadota bacterium]